MTVLLAEEVCVGVRESRIRAYGCKCGSADSDDGDCRHQEQISSNLIRGQMFETRFVPSREEMSRYQPSIQREMKA